MKLKPPSNSASQTLTATTSSHDARLLVRETLRISANLASAPPSSVPTEPLLLDTSSRLLCCEEIDGRMWKYFPDGSVSCGAMQPKKKSSIRAVGLHSPQTPIDVSFLPLRLSLCLNLISASSDFKLTFGLIACMCCFC